MATKQTAAVLAARDLMNLMGDIRTIREKAKAYVDKYNSEAYNTVWANLPTAAQNADGSLGIADGTPVISHPISTVPAGETNAIGRTQVQLVAGVTLLNDFLNFCQNVAISAAQRSQSIDDLAS